MASPDRKVNFKSSKLTGSASIFPDCTASQHGMVEPSTSQRSILLRRGAVRHAAILLAPAPGDLGAVAVPPGAHGWT